MSQNADYAGHRDLCDKCLGAGCLECGYTGVDATDPDPYKPECCLCGSRHYGGVCQ